MLTNTGRYCICSNMEMGTGQTVNLTTSSTYAGCNQFNYDSVITWSALKYVGLKRMPLAVYPQVFAAHAIACHYLDI